MVFFLPRSSARIRMIDGLEASAGKIGCESAAARFRIATVIVKEEIWTLCILYRTRR